MGVEDVDDAHQARMFERREGAGLGQQLLDEGGAGRRLQDLGEADLLDRDLPFLQQVAGPPHDAHAARAEGDDQLVAVVDDVADLMLGALSLGSHGHDATRR